MTTPAFLTGGYSPPGVYIEESTTTQVTSTGILPSDVAIVGPGVGYQTYAQQMLLTQTPTPLAKQGIDTTTLTVTRLDTNVRITGGGTDYSSTIAGTAPASTISLARVNGGAMGSDGLVLVQYNYTDPLYYTPRTLDNYADVKAIYGEPLALAPPAATDTSYKAIVSPISLAAKIAFENGASELILCASVPPASNLTGSALQNALRLALADAYTKIASNHAAAIVVPITDGLVDGNTAQAGTDLRTHVEGASNQGYYRIGILGFDPAVTAAPDQMVASGSYADGRIVQAYAGSGGMAYYNGAAGTSLALGHQYLAAAYAGMLAALPVQQGLTQQQIRSFTGVVGAGPSNSLKDRYAAGGVAVAEVNLLGALVCRHGVTTMGPSSLTQGEISLIRANDYLIQLVQIGTTQAGLIGTPITQDTPDAIKAVVAGLLEHAVGQGAILGYVGLAVTQQNVNPSVMQVVFAFQPSFPLNYIVINFSLDTTTGLATADATGVSLGIGLIGV